MKPLTKPYAVVVDDDAIILMRAGGLTSGGFDFDAKVRRQSVDAIDLIHGHIVIDVVARSLLNAAAIIEHGLINEFRRDRYAGWNGALGGIIHAESTDLAAIADLAIERNLDPRPRSGRQELIETF